MNRGQSTVEFALIGPFVAALLAITLQFGLLISDQVTLRHYAYDAGQWAQANPNLATPDGAGGQVTQHVYDQLCGPGLTPQTLGTNTPLTRFCTADLTVTVVDQKTVATADPGDMQPAAAVRCATRTKPWTFSISPSGPRTVDNSSGGGTLNYTVTASLVTAPSPSPVVSPVPSPSVTPLTPTLTLKATLAPTAATAALTVNPIQIVPGGAANTATVAWSYTTKTKPGVYSLKVTATDQCGVLQAETVQVTVGPVVVSTPAAPVTEWVDSVTPPTVCSGAGVTLDVLGGGFVPGVTVSVAGQAATVTSVGPKRVQAAFASIPPGIWTVTVAYPDGTTATLVDAVTSGCVGAGSPNPSPSPPACDSFPGFSTQLWVTIQWKEPVLIPIFGSGALNLNATSYVFCS